MRVAVRHAVAFYRYSDRAAVTHGSEQQAGRSKEDLPNHAGGQRKQLLSRHSKGFRPKNTMSAQDTTRPNRHPYPNRR